MDDAINTSFELEKHSITWNKFLYDLTLSEVSTDINSSRYDDFAFGSWVIETNGNRLVYDGRDEVLRIDIKVGTEWETQDEMMKKDLSYESLLKFVRIL